MAEEENEEAPTEEAPAEGEEPTKSKKKLFIIIGAAVALLGGGGAAFFLMSGGEEPPTETSETVTEGEPSEATDGGTPDAAASGDKPADGGTAAEAAPETGQAGMGQTYKFKTFHLNLGNPIENHYVRLEVALSFDGGEKQQAEIESRSAQLRDAIVSIASRKTREFLLGPDGKDQLRRELLIRINRFMDRPINAVYITDILIE